MTDNLTPSVFISQVRSALFALPREWRCRALLRPKTTELHSWLVGAAMTHDGRGRLFDELALVLAPDDEFGEDVRVVLDDDALTVAVRR